MLNGFFAYTSRPEVRECITTAVISINRNDQFKISTWEELKSNGTYLIDEICSKIDESELFLVDLSYINHNVLFELGYAIAKNKRIIIFLDPSIKNAKQNYSRLNLSTIHYLEFMNSTELISRFLSQDISSTLENTLLNRMYGNYPSLPLDCSGLLYLKSRHEDDASIKLSRIIEKSKIQPITVDDPNEALTQTVEWYLKQSIQAAVIIGHLIDDERESSEFHNAKVAFCAGMGYALKKKVLLLVKEPFNPSLDYLQLLIKYYTSSECHRYASRWLTEAEENTNFSTRKIHSNQGGNEVVLADADLGDYIAEQEIQTLHEYYVPIVNIKDILRSEYSLLIGRKGTGKSALLYMINHNLIQNKNHLVCIIKPVGYALEGLLKILRDLPEDSEKSYLMESLWKFLIYTELAQSVIEKINKRPTYIDYTPEELVLVDYIEKNKEIFASDFWVRFENIIAGCVQLKNVTHDRRLRISEFLHDKLVSKLRSLLVEVFSINYEKIVILVDNLDKTWKIGEQTGMLSAFLFGLISVSSRIRSEFSLKNTKTEFTLLIFLRSDIFSYIYRIARERDKLKYQQISWNNPEILLQVIEDRLIFNFPEFTSERIWTKYFCSEVNGIPIKQFIIENIVPRPRDIVFLVLEALRNAIAKRHTKIEEEDLLSAQIRYSQHALDSLIVESDIDVDDMENLLYEFAGQQRVITKDQLYSIIKKNLGEKYLPEQIIEMLCDRAFLGRQVSAGKFRYQYSFDDAIPRSLQKAFIEKTGIEEYEINAPYRKYLEIEN